VQLYGISPTAYDTHVDLFRTGGETKLHPPLTVAAMTMFHASPAGRAAAAAKAAAKAAAAAEAAAYKIDLTDVNCAKATIDSCLGPHLASECGFRHTGRPVDGSPMRVTLLLKTEHSAKKALELLAAGAKGAYRVLTTLEDLSSHGGASRAAGGFGGGRAGSGGGGSGGGASGKDGKGKADALWEDDADDADATTAATTAAIAAVTVAAPTVTTATAAAAAAVTPSPPAPAQPDESIPDAWDED
jgi:hypothetical protein